MNLKQTLSQGLLIAISLLTAGMLRAADEAPYYLFSYFMGNGKSGMHLAASRDGLVWTNLAGGKSFLTSKLADGLIRDPSIVQGADGTFHMVWTPGWWERGIGYASSMDLIHWSEPRWLPVMEHEPKALNAWAPELHFNPEDGLFMILWASTIPDRFPDTDYPQGDKTRDGHTANHRLYFTTTRDFQEFSDSRLFYDPGFSSIDGTVVRVGERWLLVFKDETKAPEPMKNIRLAWGDAMTGPFGPASESISPAWVEGPSMLHTLNGGWNLYYDAYTRKRYEGMHSTDLKTWNSITDQLKFPKGIRHGTMFAVSKEISSKLKTVGIASAMDSPPEIRTPPVPLTPRINGPAIFGVRPGHPAFYHIPASGERPMEYSATDLPASLKLDSITGNITGMIEKQGEYKMTLHAKNPLGTSERKFKIVVGETIALTPPMGWNSWNHYRDRVSQEIVLQNARAMVGSGLIDHGWSYINIDDTWQGVRGGPLNAIQGNEKFQDMKKLCSDVHSLGLKIGIYSTPWTTSYAGLIGGSAENSEGTWSKPTGQPVKKWKKIMPYAIGKYSFAKNDARQWAEWGIDYLKYDWKPNEFREAKEMAGALRESGRDMIFSLSNNMDIKQAPRIGKVANCWRTTNDIKANWQSMSERGFGQDRWRPFSGPGHWNDPDMLEIGTKEQDQPGLTPDEEYTHMTLWSLICAPLLLGANMEGMSPFTLNLLTNDEVIAVNQDSLGDQALAVAKEGEMRVYAKKLEDGSMAVGLFNLNGKDRAIVSVKWSDLNLLGSRSVRDLWRQKNWGKFDDHFSMDVAPHGAELIKIAP